MITDIGLIVNQNNSVNKEWTSTMSYEIGFKSFNIKQYIDGHLGMEINKSNTLYIENSAFLKTYTENINLSKDCLKDLISTINETWQDD